MFIFCIINSFEIDFFSRFVNTNMCVLALRPHLSIVRGTSVWMCANVQCALNPLKHAVQWQNNLEKSFLMISRFYRLLLTQRKQE